MQDKVKSIKQSVFKILVTSIILFLFLFVITVILALVVESNWRGLWIGLVFLAAAFDLMFLLSIICGAIFLRANKKIDDVEKFKAKRALDVGMFYFVVSNKIDRLINVNEKINTPKNGNHNVV
ncbi:hypothetical protein SCHIN_v1c07060 [Spiroplasma chinense]|uniref:Transmembrane protein n=1 Tax=Spiroplasma chinense TaxID=216932 RepID=A0A5B9Y539_9MOLU|nr:hypothetical protein [Spiroplasma chinense]QEH61903.1 hypothetical protein SCHIN_v1c07060 [Spiroplasma chinense]